MDVATSYADKNYVLQNPFFENARPILHVNAATDGFIVVNGTPVRLSGNRGRLYIDSDTRQAYYKTEGEGGQIYNANSAVDNTDFFLAPGANEVYAGEGMVVRIKPRWWTI